MISCALDGSKYEISLKPCYQYQPPKFDVKIVLELINSTGRVLNRWKPIHSQDFLVPTNEKYGCPPKIFTADLSSLKNYVKGQEKLKVKAIIFTRDPEKPFNPLPETISMMNSSKELFNDRENGDVTIKASDGHEIRVHKFPLIMRSKTFKTMFEIDMTEKQTGIVEIKDFDSTVLNELFRFIYYNEVEGIGDVYDELLRAAKRYEIGGISEMCERYIIQNFESFESKEMLELLKLADYYDMEELSQFIVSIFFA